MEPVHVSPYVAKGLWWNGHRGALMEPKQGQAQEAFVPGLGERSGRGQESKSAKERGCGPLGFRPQL